MSQALPIETLLKQSKEAFLQISTLSTAQKNEALLAFAQLVEDGADFLLAENQKDLEAQKDQLAPSMFQRLKLDKAKIMTLVQGIRDVSNLPDPVGEVLSKTQLDEGLILEKVSVPLGVVGIIFESRPDVIPQILSLILKSSNAVVLKGGKEAYHSNLAFMALVDKLNTQCSFLPKHWAQLLDGREAVHQMLNYPQYVDLVIPRGSNQLVQSIMAATKIPVLGHADGICHLYVHPSADLTQTIPIIIDAKAQYPSACNALETLLVDESVANAFLPQFEQAVCKVGITLKGCDKTRQYLPNIEQVTQEDWKTEYGDLTLAVKVVSNLQEAIEHINQYGSHHTDGILAQDTAAQTQFTQQVDSASVFVNASTRFADGFRYGLGAEIGISTAKTHARGPVGLEGLVIYKYKLTGNGQIVATYTGNNAKPFQHQKL
jgi:glutamate-5-semialdehyde dehydrogenase